MIRFRIFILLFLFAFVGVIARLFYWQILKSRDLSVQARDQYESTSRVQAARGNILSSDKSFLAARSTSYLVYAALPEIEMDKEKLANMLAPFFLTKKNDDPEANNKQLLLDETVRIYNLLTKKDVVWIPLKRQVASDIKKNIESLKLSGIGFESEEARIYPEASSAAQLLGFVGKDNEGENVGYFGLEGYYNLALSGKPGFTMRENDAKGIPLVFGESQDVAAISGVDLVTNIDKTVQLSLEKRLKEGLEKYGAKSASAIIMRPGDGAILGMTSLPSYDPSSYSKFDQELFKNPVISDAFEPGSIFKVLVMAAAIDKGVVEPDTKCDICGGAYKIDKYSIETWDNKYYPDTSMTDVIVHSDNVGMVYSAQKVGADSLYDYLDKFGIGKLTEVDLQGEVTPKMRAKGSWGIVDLATTSFGQGIAVTSIQMLRAVAAIANGGVLPTPQVVKELKKDGWEQNIKQGGSERVISKESAEKIAAMMGEAATRGESQWAKPKGFSVAGKTGTAQIPIAGHYDAKNTIASFIGFAPVVNPKFVMLVTLKEPQSSQWAAETAAPLWYSISKDLFPYFGIQPEN